MKSYSMEYNYGMPADDRVYKIKGEERFLDWYLKITFKVDGGSLGTELEHMMMSYKQDVLMTELKRRVIQEFYNYH